MRYSKPYGHGMFPMEWDFSVTADLKFVRCSIFSNFTSYVMNVLKLKTKITCSQHSKS